MAAEPIGWTEGNRIVSDLGREANLAARIARERKAREWSQSELAREMAEVGCPIPQTAISKIEKPQAGGPRAITVDEAIAFAKVFDIPFGELFLPTDALASVANARLLDDAYTVMEEKLMLDQRYEYLVNKVAVAASKDPAFAAQLTEQRQLRISDLGTVRARRLVARPGWLRFLDDVAQVTRTLTDRGARLKRKGTL